MALLFSGARLNGSPAPQRFVPGQLLVKTRAHVTDSDADSKLKRHGALPRRKLKDSDVRVVSVAEDQAEAVLASLRADSEIEFVERDYLAHTTYLPNDPMVLSGAEWHLSGIQAPEAWDITTGRSNVLVAVIDSGVAAHSDLTGQLVSGYDFVNNDSDPTDDLGHGTAVAGTIAAAGNNGFGVAGVAFGCRVLPVKVVDSTGYASYSRVAQGIRYAVSRGARVINVSLAGYASSITLQQAVNYAWSNNVVIVASAGNNADSSAQYPAACTHVIGVSALTRTGSLAAFSTFGTHVDIAAPGEAIWTTQRDGSTPFASWSGTSFAAPIVAGTAALMLASNPSLSNSRVAALLATSADDLGATGNDVQFGAGRVNAYRAVLAAGNEPGGNPDDGSEPDPSLDKTIPTLTVVSGPRNNARLLAAELQLTGVANDDIAVREVQVEVNGEKQIASGTKSWEAPIILSPGPNTIRISSVDSSGNVSLPVVRMVTYVAMAPITISTEGIGTVVPNLNGKVLEIGKSYKLKAVPAPGQAFAGWTGAEGESPNLVFLMTQGLAIKARFVVSPFPTVKGNYAGLIAETNGVTPETAGAFNVTVTAAGRFTGRMTLGAARHSFKGQLNLNGEAAVTVGRRDQSPLDIRINVDLTGQTDQLTGSVSDGARISEVVGDRNTFNSKMNPAPQAGSRGFVLLNKANALTAGSGTSVIASGGTVRIKGRLGDGRAFSAGSMLARNGDCPLYVALNAASETVIGWLNFPALSGTAASGTVAWVRTGTNSFATTLEATSSQLLIP